MNEEDKLQRLVFIEKRYHLFKAILIVLATLVVLITIVFETNKSVDKVNQKNQRVENLLRCSLPAFTPKNYAKADDIINQCLQGSR